MPRRVTIKGDEVDDLWKMRRRGIVIRVALSRWVRVVTSRDFNRHKTFIPLHSRAFGQQLRLNSKFSIDIALYDKNIDKPTQSCNHPHHPRVTSTSTSTSSPLPLSSTANPNPRVPHNVLLVLAHLQLQARHLRFGEILFPSQSRPNTLQEKTHLADHPDGRRL